MPEKRKMTKQVRRRCGKNLKGKRGPTTMVNFLYMKYALAIADCGSVNKAAEKLFIDQPNLSRALRELESSLGVKLFIRSAKGTTPTPDGEAFLEYAKTILMQVNTLEEMFKDGAARKLRFSLSAPRASYVAEAFTDFSDALTRVDKVEVYYRETDSMQTIKNVVEDGYHLGIVRYAEDYDKYYKEMFENNGLDYEFLGEFRFRLVFSKESLLANEETITPEMLKDYIEIVQHEPYIPSIPTANAKIDPIPEADRRIYVFERASQFELLTENKNTYMWTPPIPIEVLDRFDLTFRVCDFNQRYFRDMLIRMKDYRMTDLDSSFITQLCIMKRRMFLYETRLTTVE